MRLRAALAAHGRQLADAVSARVLNVTRRAPFNHDFKYRSQTEDAIDSVCRNIAEGFGRGTKRELITFLYIAEGSADEVRSMLAVMQGYLG